MFKVAGMLLARSMGILSCEPESTETQWKNDSSDLTLENAHVAVTRRESDESLLERCKVAEAFVYVRFLQALISEKIVTESDAYDVCIKAAFDRKNMRLFHALSYAKTIPKSHVLKLSEILPTELHDKICPEHFVVAVHNFVSADSAQEALNNAKINGTVVTTLVGEMCGAFYGIMWIKTEWLEQESWKKYGREKPLIAAAEKMVESHFSQTLSLF